MRIQQGPKSPRAVRGALHWADAAVLLAVGVVVLLVSLPRLREFALRENESDARALVARLGELASQGAPPSTLAETLERAPLLAQRLEDVAWLEHGALLRRHGYLFELVADGAGPRICAWPWEHRRTGCMAFRWSAAGVESHPNDAGAWSGLERRPSESSDARANAAWRPLAP